MIRKAVIVLLMLSLLLPAGAFAEIDDSTLFMDAFNAFQRKDYLLSVEKLGKLNQLFPDSPLRDVSLLMLARSYQRSGDNDTAGQTINRFFSEFSGNSISASVEDELIALGKRRKNGEKLAQNRQLRLAAQKVRADQLAHERAAAEKIERERLARERAEREKIARERAEAERREQERLAALKAARDAVKFEIETAPAKSAIAVGTKGALAFTLINRGTGVEEFTLELTAPANMENAIANAADPGKPVRTVTLKPRESFKGTVALPIPPALVDGSRTTATVKVSSVKFNDLAQQRDIQAIASAPLLRVVSRMTSNQLKPAEQASYKVSVLNAGSLAAKEVDLRITLPARLKLVNAGENGCWIENEQMAACRISNIASGSMSERTLTVAVRDGGEEAKLRASVDLVQTVLQTKQSFPGSPFNIVKP